MGLLSRAEHALGDAAQAIANPEFERLHPRVKAGEKGAGRFIDVLGSLEKWKARFHEDTGVWDIPTEHKAEFLDTLEQLGWTARVVPPGMREATPEDRKRLKIPPGYRDALVSDNPDKMPNGLLWLAVTPKGEDKFEYTDAKKNQQAAQKFARIRALMRNMNELDERLGNEAGTDPTAAALMLIRKMGLRPGSKRDRKTEHKAYGATTLERRHIRIEGDTVHLDFIGKEGVHNVLQHEDHELAQTLRRYMKGKGGSDALFSTSEDRLGKYMADIVPGATPKDLRTHLATGTANLLISAYPTPTSEKEFKQFRNEIADEVSKVLGNQREQALKSYIDPAVWGAWAGFDNPDAVHEISAPPALPTPTASQAALLEQEIMPERGDLYFDTDPTSLAHKYGPVDVREIDMSQITPIRAREEGIKNARKFMIETALSGDPDSKHDPITLIPQPGGGYKVYDGDSTFANATEQGWGKVHAIVAKDEKHAKHIEKVAKLHKQRKKRLKRLTEHPESGEVEELIGPDGEVKTRIIRQVAPDRTRYQDEAHVESTHAALRAMAQDGEDGKPVQEFPDIDTMFKTAAKDHGRYEDILKTAGRTFGAKHYEYDAVVGRAKKDIRGPMVLTAPLKGRSRSMEKINGKYQGDHNRLQDVLRATIVTDSYEDMPDALEAVRAEATRRGWKVRGFENKYLGPPPAFNAGPTPAGYRDMKVSLVSPSGVVTELQFNTLPMLAAKEGPGHKLYEQQRSIEDKAAAEGRDLSASERKRVNALFKEQQALYNVAWRGGYG